MRDKKKGRLQFSIAMPFIEIVVFGIMGSHIRNVFGFCRAQKIRRAGNEMRELSKRYGELALDAGLAAGGVLPPPAGTAVDAVALGKSLAKGDWWGAAFDVIGFVPILGDGIKGGRIAWKLRDLGKVVDQVMTGMAKTFSKTEDAAKAFWASKRNMGAYRDALKVCDGTTKCLDAAALKKGQQYKTTPKSGPKGNWKPAEGRGDGEWVPEPGSELAEAIKPGTSITYENGFPKFDDFSLGEVKIPQTGNSNRDLSLADSLYKKNTGQDRPSGYTWHHKEDGTTMQLIPARVNNNAGHAGGQSLFGTTSTGQEF